MYNSVATILVISSGIFTIAERDLKQNTDRQFISAVVSGSLYPSYAVDLFLLMTSDSVLANRVSRHSVDRLIQEHSLSVNRHSPS
jgi:hypothetical protein